MTLKVPPLAERVKPGLSETLRGPRQPDRCQSCGAADSLERWEECDAWDQPKKTLLFLCEKCSKRLIQAHPRLYVKRDLLAPCPGVMLLCVKCKHRTALACLHPKLQANGGDGLLISFPRPTRVHLNYGGGRGEFRNLYPGPPTQCVGREEYHET